MMCEMRAICAVVVVYNVKCGESPTCQALSHIVDTGLQVLIFDNSTTELGNRLYCEQKGWVYLGGSGNVGLSKAYNNSIAYLKQNNQTSFVCLFDDDTHINADYFSALHDAMGSTSRKIFVPLIFSGDSLLSPCVLYPNHRTKCFLSEADAMNYAGNSISAINSCMALDLSLFDDYQYDENIFLDGIDHKFISDMRSRGEQICVFPYRCHQEFSGYDIPSIENAKKRFVIFAKDYRYIFRKNILKYCYLVGKRALKLCIQYRIIWFILSFWQCLISFRFRDTNSEKYLRGL